VAALLVLASAIMVPGVMIAGGQAEAVSRCSRTSNHAGYATYNCYMYRPSVRLWFMYGTSKSFYIRGNYSGILNRGTSWFVCQRRFPVVKMYNGPYANDWWAYTLGDNGYWGWINVIFLSSGSNWKAVPGLAICPSGFGDSQSWPGNTPRGGKSVVLDSPDAAKVVIDDSAAAYIYIGP
jgi:hypothetical protein